jgi:hypothetical protein
MDIYSTISSPGELATYASPKVYQNPFGSGGGSSQLEALMGPLMQQLEMKRKMMGLDLLAKQKSMMPNMSSRATQRDKEHNPNNEMPEMSYVRNISGFNQTPGAVQTGAGDVGAVMGGWMPGGGNRGARVQGGGSGPDMGPSLPSYGAGASAFRRAPQSDDDERADYYGLNSRASSNQLKALRR